MRRALCRAALKGVALVEHVSWWVAFQIDPWENDR